MDTHDALIAAILANPKDDLPRLVYADWLDENGQPERAEFIRVQLELAKCKDPEVSLKYSIHAQQLTGGGEVPNHELWFGTDLILWLNEIPKHSGTPSGAVTRGFVSEVRCTLAEWVGGVCGRCGGGGAAHWFNTPGCFCPTCNGSGQIAIGPEVVRRHPVEVVRLSGAVIDNGGSVVRWHRVTRESVGVLWPFLDTIRRNYTNFDYIEFSSRDSADAMVSAAALAWAKSHTPATAT